MDRKNLSLYSVLIFIAILVEISNSSPLLSTLEPSTYSYIGQRKIPTTTTTPAPPDYEDDYDYEDEENEVDSPRLLQRSTTKEPTTIIFRSSSTIIISPTFPPDNPLVQDTTTLPPETTTVTTSAAPTTTAGPTTTNPALKVATLILDPMLFSYNDFRGDGPSNWTGTCADGKQQSPITLIQNSYVVSPKFSRIKFFSSFDKQPESIRLRNYGYGVSVIFNYENDIYPRITGGPLEENVYIFSHVRLHWPCEHRFAAGVNKITESGQPCILELHLIHFHQKYKTVIEASKKPDGLAIVTMMFIASNMFNVRSLPFINMLKKVNTFNSTYLETNSSSLFTYHDLLLHMTSPRVISYRGSLTMPPCTESVTWIVIPTPQFLVQSDVTELQKLLDVRGDRVMRNNRPLQPLNARKVEIHINS